MKHNRPSIIRYMKLRGYFISGVFFVSMCVGPYFFYHQYLEYKVERLYNYVSTSHTQDEALSFAHTKGYTIFFKEDAYSKAIINGDKCKPVKVDRVEDEVLALYDQGCGDVTYSVNSELLDGYFKLLVVYGIIAVIIFLIYNLVLFIKFKKNLTMTINQINNQIENIKIANEKMDINDYNFYQEFERIFETIITSTTKINEYVNERELLTETLNHELKTPLNKISSLLQAYKLNLPGYDNQEELFSNVNKEIEGMTETINYSLNIFSTKLNEEIEEINVNEKIEEMIKKWQRDFEVRNVVVKIDNREDFYIQANKTNFELVLSNIIGNCLKYSRKDSKVKIVIDKNKIGFINEIDPMKTSGTQRGIKLSTQILKTYNLSLNYREYNKNFEVYIKK